MVIRDVDQWVDKILAEIRGFRPHLTEADRAIQATILKSLSTQEFNFILPEGQTAIEFSDKKGIVNEYLVRLDPDFLSREMSEKERAVEAYMLSYLRTYSPHVPLIPNNRFHSPDGFVIRVEVNKAWIDAIVEIKTTGSSKDLKRQLRGINEDLPLALGFISHNLEYIRRYFGTKPDMPDAGQSPWPRKVRSIRLNSGYQKILYLSADREVKDGEIEGWQIRRSRFSIGEVTHITNLVWNDLVAKGGAAVAEEEASVAIHQAPDVARTVRPEGTIDVRKHDGVESQMATSIPATQRGCQRCKDEPLLFVDSPTGGNRAPFSEMVYEDGKGAFRIPLGIKCSTDSVITLYEQVCAKSNEVIDAVEVLLGDDLSAWHKKMEEDADQVMATDGVDPVRFRIAAEAFREILRNTRLNAAGDWIKTGLAVLGDRSSVRINQVRERLTKLERMRMDMSRNALGMEVESERGYTATPDDQPDVVLEHVTNASQLLWAAKRILGQVGEAIQDLDLEVNKTISEQAVRARYREKTGKDLPEAKPRTAERNGRGLVRPELEKKLPAAMAESEVESSVPVCSGEEHHPMTENAKFCSECGLPSEPALSQAPSVPVEPSIRELLLPSEVVDTARAAGAEAEQVRATAADEAPSAEPAATGQPPVAVANPNQIICDGCGAKNNRERIDCRACGEYLN